ncbi:MAG: prolipoprotein diacylglyceryl transferase, partial [Ginsengibacter sp.]
FTTSYYILSKIFINENKNIELLNRLTLYIFLGTIIGARLGDCFFYDWNYFKKVPWEIVLPFKIQNGHLEFTGYQGLASHGGALGILTAVWLYNRKYKLGLLWILDRLGIAVALAGFFIRTGNFFNSEIIGKPSNVPWAIVFDKVDEVPRHPAMLYEAICYLVIFFILYQLYKIKIFKVRRGLLFGIFLVLLFSVRFCLEFFKENQEVFENHWPLNLGQLLSVPFIIAGCWLIIKKYKAVPIENL